jgi:hypothetical protein
MPQLRRLMLAEIRKHEGCEDITDVRILRSDDSVECNWSAAVVGLGRAQLNVARRAAMYAQSTLASKYDLLPVDESPSQAASSRWAEGGEVMLSEPESPDPLPRPPT